MKKGGIILAIGLRLLILFSLIFCILIPSFFLTTPNKKPIKFGATYMTMDNEFFEVLNSSIREVIESNGDLLITRDPASSQEKQNAQILDMIEQGVTVIFINPVKWNKINKVLKICNEQNVHLINVDTNVYLDQYVDNVILSDNYDAGAQIAYDFMQKKANAKIVVLQHDGIKSTELRIDGFFNTLNKHNFSYEIVKKITTLATLEDSMIKMSAFLENPVEFDMVIGGNDPTALGALAAIEKKSINKNIMIYGIDGSPSAKKMVEQGSMEGTSAQFPLEMGKKAVKTAYKILQGKKITPFIIHVPVTLITKKNIANFDILGWQ